MRTRDTGAGLRPEDIPLRFKPFARVGTAKAPPGSGLGTYISHLIMERHGGRIWAESDEVGKGSTFGFALRRSAPRVPRA